MTAEVTTTEQQINPNVRNDERTGEMSAAKEEERIKQHAARQKESRKRKLVELTAHE